MDRAGDRGKEPKIYIPYSRFFSRAEWGTQLVAHVFRALDGTY